jgi:hypothetical protein
MQIGLTTRPPHPLYWMTIAFTTRPSHPLSDDSKLDQKTTTSASLDGNLLNHKIATILFV